MLDHHTQSSTVENRMHVRKNMSTFADKTDVLSPTFFSTHINSVTDVKPEDNLPYMIGGGTFSHLKSNASPESELTTATPGQITHFTSAKNSMEVTPYDMWTKQRNH